MRWVSFAAVGLLIASSSCADRTAPETDSASQPAEVPTVLAPGDDAAQDAESAADAPPTEPPALLSAEEIAAGWIALFDGHSLFGWKANSQLNWSVADGVITADKGEPGLLLTSAPFADYELRCDFRLEKGGNSGVFLRTVFQPKDPAKDCYELNICDSHPAFPTGSFVGRQKPEATHAVEGEWKTFHVRAEGAKLAVQLDGQPIIELDDMSDGLRKSGLIGLQMNGGKIEFRNVFLRPLSVKPIFNGEDVSGWREVPGSKSKFTVEDGAMHVTNGPGFLETEDTWADFVLQADVKTNGKSLNSGIFFRAKPGTEAAPSHGYEFQIHNGYRDGDRTQPVDFGTGAIFRRQKARRVVADDNQWCTITLVAQGPHFATWVGGYPVVVWTDERQPSDNPREGLRLEVGHLSLQGHDPTTDLDFKNLRIAPLPEG